jgi:hypothetical protein
MTLGPKSFPSLVPPSFYRRHRTARPFHVCRVCGLCVEPRNSRRHASACSRRKRQDPALWAFWRMEMHNYTEQKIRQHLAPGYRRELVERGYLQHGPLDRRGRFSGEGA